MTNAENSLPGRSGDPPVVNSHNEWDPLEEVIVGVVDQAAVPTWHVTLEATMSEACREFSRQNGAGRFPEDLVAAAREDLERFVRLLEGEGIVVHRPDLMDHARSYATPDWQSPAGLYSAMPRDVLLVVGDEIIEAPMAWRSRYFEANAYRSLIKDYFRRGARWTAAPKPELKDELYDHDWRKPGEDEEMAYVITEFEPTFDAADFVRCGRDLFVQRSQVTNQLGIDWLARHLGGDYRIHTVETEDKKPMHIDATLMPLAPGKLLVNPERLGRVPEPFRDWQILQAPLPTRPQQYPFSMCSRWISMNVLSLDEKRVVVEEHEEPLLRALEGWGFEPVPCSLNHFNAFGGGFHCATADIRRRGALESYF